MFLDPALFARRSPDLFALSATTHGPAKPIRLSRPPRPLYVSEVLSSPRLPVFESTLQAPDPGEAAPVALNSFDAMKSGLPAGPYRAGLIEEQDNDPERPRIVAGTVTWRTEPGAGSAPDTPPAAIVAEVTIEGPGIKATLSMRPVRDGAGPTIVFDISFDGMPSPPQQIGLPELRNAGIDRGIPLFATIEAAGTAFLVVLSRDQFDGEQNVRLLTGRPWIDVPVRLQDGRRLIIAFEKGTAVRDMLRNALRLWRMPWLP